MACRADEQSTHVRPESPLPVPNLFFTVLIPQELLVPRPNIAVTCVALEHVVRQCSWPRPLHRIKLWQCQRLFARPNVLLDPKNSLGIRILILKSSYVSRPRMNGSSKKILENSVLERVESLLPNDRHDFLLMSGLLSQRLTGLADIPAKTLLVELLDAMNRNQVSAPK